MRAKVVVGPEHANDVVPGQYVRVMARSVRQHKRGRRFTIEFELEERGSWNVKPSESVRPAPRITVNAIGGPNTYTPRGVRP